jgi:hypothetical protein
VAGQRRPPLWGEKTKQWQAFRKTEKQRRPPLWGEKAKRKCCGGLLRNARVCPPSPVEPARVAVRSTTLSADLARLTRCLLRCRSGIQGGESRSSRCRRSPHDCRRIRADVSRSGGSFRVDRSGVASTCCRGCRQTRVSCDGSPFSRLHRPRAGLNCLRVCQHDPKVASHRSNPPQHGSAGEAQPAISDGTKQWGWGSAPAPGALDRALAVQWRRRKRFTAGWVRGRVRVRRGARRTAAGAAAIPIHFHRIVPVQTDTGGIHPDILAG